MYDCVSVNECVNVYSYLLFSPYNSLSHYHTTLHRSPPQDAALTALGERVTALESVPAPSPRKAEDAEQLATAQAALEAAKVS